MDDVKMKRSALVVDRGVNQIHGSDNIVAVIESLDEVAQALGGVGRQVINMLKPVFAEKLVHK